MQESYQLSSLLWYGNCMMQCLCPILAHVLHRKTHLIQRTLMWSNIIQHTAISYNVILGKIDANITAYSTQQRASTHTHVEPGAATSYGVKNADISTCINVHQYAVKSYNGTGWGASNTNTHPLPLYLPTPQPVENKRCSFSYAIGSKLSE